MSSEQRIAEAITDVTRQLEAWEAPDAAAKADVIVKSLMRDGWRPRGPRYEPPTGKPGTVPPPEVRKQYADKIRAALNAQGWGDGSVTWHTLQPIERQWWKATAERFTDSAWWRDQQARAADLRAEGAAEAADAFVEWASKAEIAEPPLDWAWFGEIARRYSPMHEDHAPEGEHA